MKTRVRDWMARDVLTLRDDLPLTELDERFIADRVSGYPVVSKEGHLIGVVSRSDVVRQLAIERSWAETWSDYYTDWSQVDPKQPSLAEIGERTGRRLEERVVRDAMVREPVSISPDASLAEAARTLVERRIHRLPVVEDRKLVGILTSLDVARFVAESATGSD